MNAWHYWWLINGNSTGNESLIDTNGTPAKRMYALGNFSRFIRPNFYRIGVPTNTGPLQISAYKDLVSSNFVLVAINSGNTSVTQIFNLANFTTGSVTPWITSSNLSLASNAPIAVLGSTFTNVLLPMSIVSFVGQANHAPNTPTNLSPVNLSAGQSLTTTLQASVFTDPDAGDTQSASEWIIQNTSDNSLVLDTGLDAIHTTSLTVPSGPLAYGTAYNWSVRYADNNGGMEQLLHVHNILDAYPQFAAHQPKRQPHPRLVRERRWLLPAIYDQPQSRRGKLVAVNPDFLLSFC